MEVRLPYIARLAIVKLSLIYWTLPLVKSCLNFCVVFRTPADPSLALQRSRSSLQLKESRDDDSSKDFPWSQDIQEMVGSMQDTSFNRSEPFRVLLQVPRPWSSNTSGQRPQYVRVKTQDNESFNRSELDNNTLSPSQGYNLPIGQDTVPQQVRILESSPGSDCCNRSELDHNKLLQQVKVLQQVRVLPKAIVFQ